MRYSTPDPHPESEPMDSLSLMKTARKFQFPKYQLCSLLIFLPSILASETAYGRNVMFG